MKTHFSSAATQRQKRRVDFRQLLADDHHPLNLKYWRKAPRIRRESQISKQYVSLRLILAMWIPLGLGAYLALVAEILSQHLRLPIDDACDTFTYPTGTYLSSFLATLTVDVMGILQSVRRANDCLSRKAKSIYCSTEARKPIKSSQALLSKTIFGQFSSWKGSSMWHL